MTSNKKSKFNANAKGTIMTTHEQDEALAAFTLELQSLHNDQLRDLYNSVHAEGQPDVVQFSTLAVAVQAILDIHAVTPLYTLMPTWREAWAEEALDGVDYGYNLPEIAESIYAPLHDAAALMEASDPTINEAVKAAKVKSKTPKEPKAPKAKKEPRDPNAPKLPRQPMVITYINFLAMCKDITVKDEGRKKPMRAGKESIRSIALGLMLRPKGATEGELYSLFEGRTITHSRQTRMRELVRILCGEYGYGFETIDYNNVRILTTETQRGLMVDELKHAPENSAPVLELPVKEPTAPKVPKEPKQPKQPKVKEPVLDLDLSEPTIETEPTLA